MMTRPRFASAAPIVSPKVQATSGASCVFVSAVPQAFSRAGPPARATAVVRSRRTSAWKPSSDQVKTALGKVQQLEQAWGKEFAQPLIDKRKDVDSGNATVAELQIYYLQKDASSWVKNSTDALDVADIENRKLVDEFYKAAIAAGGKDNGAPGIREIYHPNYCE